MFIKIIINASISLYNTDWISNRYIYGILYAQLYITSVYKRAYNQIEAIQIILKRLSI